MIASNDHSIWVRQNYTSIQNWTLSSRSGFCEDTPNIEDFRVKWSIRVSNGKLLNTFYEVS